MRHLNEHELALYATGEAGSWRGLLLGVHVRGCDECRRMVREYRFDRERLRVFAEELPADRKSTRLNSSHT